MKLLFILGGAFIGMAATIPNLWIRVVVVVLLYNAGSLIYNKAS